MLSSNEDVSHTEVPSQDNVSSEVSTEAIHADDVLTQNPLFGDTESTDEEDKLVVPRLKEPLPRSWKDGWLPMPSSSDNDNEEWEKEAARVAADGEGECHSCAAAPEDVTMEEDPGVQVGRCSDELRTER